MPRLGCSGGGWVTRDVSVMAGGHVGEEVFVGSGGGEAGWREGR